MFSSVLIANRGEIARRIVRTCRVMGISPIGVHSAADAEALHVLECDESILLGDGPPSDSYLDIAKVLDAARQTGAEAVHPGYGFLSENAEFAQAVIDAGLVWVGPSPKVIELMGDKIEARNSVQRSGVPVAAGTQSALFDAESALKAAADLGYPLMVKAVAGGGGIGMGIAHDDEGLRRAFETASSGASRFFGSAAILLERYIPRARHVEVQVLGLRDGRAVALGERDCSVQRRHQKVIEETPSPGLSENLRESLYAAAILAAETVDYRGAGTVEFLVDVDAQDFVFLEMNTRLQVEHPITELTFDVDLVEQQFLIACGAEISFDPAIKQSGHAIEMRVYAEDPVRFFPSPGTIIKWAEPTGPDVRVDSAYHEGDVVTPFYDPLLAKLCVLGSTREQALSRARASVSAFTIEGVKVNLPFLFKILESDTFVSGDYDTNIVSQIQA